MATSEKFESADLDLAKAKHYIRQSGSNLTSRPYFKGIHCSVDNIEVDNRGLHRLEGMIRMAFVQMMREDALFGRQEGFIDYMIGLSKNFEESSLSDWQPEQSSARASEFMISFYTIYSHQWKRHGRSVGKSLASFLEIMRECLDLSYIRLSEKFDSLPGGSKNDVNKAFFLANSRIDDWYEEKVAEISAP